MELIYFSPTGTTCSILEAIAQGMGGTVSHRMNLTFPRNGLCNDSSPAIIGVPVYAGRVPVTAAERLRKQVHGNGRPAILVVVYGNRAFEDALLELRDIAEELGFIPIAGAAFVGEHSFSTAEMPIAAGRPDAADRQRASAFGQAVTHKLAQIHDLSTMPRLNVPGTVPYREGIQGTPIAPETLVDKCVLCGECEQVCPTTAITVTAESVETDKTLCLRCCACTRLCPHDARTLTHPRVQEFRQMLHGKFARRAEPETFL